MIAPVFIMAGTLRLGGRPGRETSRPCMSFPPARFGNRTPISRGCTGQGRNLRSCATESGAFPAALTDSRGVVLTGGATPSREGRALPGTYSHPAQSGRCLRAGLSALRLLPDLARVEARPARLFSGVRHD